MSTYVWTEEDGLWESNSNYSEPPVGSMFYNPFNGSHYWTAHACDIPGKEDRIAWRVSTHEEIQRMKTYLLIAGVGVPP